ATATVLVIVFALIGLNPLVEVFGYMAGVATVGMVMLMLTTTISVIAYFLKNPELRKNRWTSTFIRIVAVIVLIIAAILVLSYFTMITEGSLMVSVILALLPPTGFVIGFVVNRKDHRRVSVKGAEGALTDSQ